MEAPKRSQAERELQARARARGAAASRTAAAQPSAAEAEGSVAAPTAAGASPVPPAAGASAGRPADPYDSLVAPSWTARGAASAANDLFHDAAGALRPEMLALVLAGAFALRGRPGARAGFSAAVVGAYSALLFALAMNVGYVSERHALPPLMLLLGYGAAGALWLGARLARVAPGEVRGPGGRRARAATALLLAGVTAICLGKVLRRDGVEALAERRAAEWVRDHAPGRVVAARKRRVAYYAGAPFVPLRPKTAEGFEVYFDDHDVGLVVVNRDDVPEYVGLAELVGARLRELQRIEAEGEVALVYAYRQTEIEPAPR
jgi:hypothetical protein